mgnify:CR=1 FL=1
MPHPGSVCVALVLLTTSTAGVLAQGLPAGEYEARRKELRQRYANAQSHEEKAGILWEFKQLQLAQSPGGQTGWTPPDPEEAALLAALNAGLGGVSGASGSSSGAPGSGLGSNGGVADPFEPIAQILRQFPIGQQALAAKDLYGIPIRFSAGAAMPAQANVDFVNGTVAVVIRSGQDPVTAALYFIHEMHHVSMFRQGVTLDPKKAPSMEWYVEAMTREESDGTALSIRGRMEYEAVLKRKTSVPAFPGEHAYRDAFQLGIESGRSAEESHSGARDHLFFRFRWGVGIMGPKGPEYDIAPAGYRSYPAYYEKEWRGANGKP